jgi:hypothetical protein
MTLKAAEGTTVAALDLRERATADPIGAQAHQANKRRSTRVVIDFPVMVFGQDLDGKIFGEKTKTMTVNAHGALIGLRIRIDPQKPVYLENIKIGAEVQCRVVFQKDSKNDLFEVALEFATPNARFWGMNFPPDDWNPADRKKVTSPHRPVTQTKNGSNR